MTCPSLAAGWAAQADPASQRIVFKQSLLYPLLSLPGTRCTQHIKLWLIPRGRRPELCCIFTPRLGIFAELEIPRDLEHQHLHVKGMSWSQTHLLAQTKGFPFFFSTQLKTLYAHWNNSKYSSSATRKQNPSHSQQHSLALLYNSERPVPFSRAAQTHVTFSWERMSICSLSLTTASAQHLPVPLPNAVSRQRGYRNQ